MYCHFGSTYCRRSSQQIEHLLPLSDSFACPHSSPTETSPGLYWLHGHLSEKILKCINFISNLLRTSLANPQESNKSRWLAVASTSSQHLRQLPSILGKPFAKIYQYRNNILFSLPTQTVSRMSGMSQPIPAHFVLTRSRQSLVWK